MAQIAIEIQRLPHHHGLNFPEYASARASGCDLQAALPHQEELILPPGEQVVVPTGIAVAIPWGFDATVRPRSGLAANQEIGITNSPGTIDSDYRGEVKVVLRNFGKSPFVIQRGDRIAQLVITPVVQAQWIEMSTLPVSVRNDAGFGSTGLGANDRRTAGMVQPLASWGRPTDNPT